jgi:Arc/MetJ family transcription regulator
MRTSVGIDDDLIRTALKHSGLKTKKQIIEEGLKLLIRVNRQKEIRGFRGKLKWTGNSSKTR